MGYYGNRYYHLFRPIPNLPLRVYCIYFSMNFKEKPLFLEYIKNWAIFGLIWGYFGNKNEQIYQFLRMIKIIPKSALN